MSKKLTVREAINLSLSEEMERDETVIILGEEVAQYQGAYKITQGLLDKFGEKRVIDTPISEYGFTGIAVGASWNGLKPVVEYMSFNFAMQAMDHIVNSAAKTFYMSGGEMNSPIVFRGLNGLAKQVAAQHSQNYASWFANVPGLKVVAPYSASDAYGLLKTAIRDPNPVIFLEHEMLYAKEFNVPESIELVEFGKANIIQEGDDVTIVTFSLQVKYAIEAAEILLSENIKVEIIDIRSIKPLDKETIINSVKKTGRLVVIEEGWYFGGVAASIAGIIMYEAFDYFDSPIEIISGIDVPLPYASNLEKISTPSTEDIIKSVHKVLYKNRY